MKGERRRKWGNFGAIFIEIGDESKAGGLAHSRLLFSSLALTRPSSASGARPFGRACCFGLSAKRLRVPRGPSLGNPASWSIPQAHDLGALMRKSAQTISK